MNKRGLKKLFAKCWEACDTGTKVMFEDLENGKFIPIANGGIPQTVFPQCYNSWYEYLDCDQVAYDCITEQYFEFLHSKGI